MKPTIKEFGKRIYLFFNNEKVKMIPERYRHIKAKVLNKLITEREKLRLTKDERFQLEYYLFLQSLKKSEPYTYEYINKLKPISIHFVYVKFGNDRTEIHYKDGLRAKCPFKLYTLFNNTSDIKSST